MLRHTMQVTVDELKQHLRLPANADEIALQRFLHSAADTVEMHIGHDYGTEIVPDGVEEIILELAGTRYEKRMLGVRSSRLTSVTKDWGDEQQELLERCAPYRKFVGL